MNGYTGHLLNPTMRRQKGRDLLNVHHEMLKLWKFTKCLRQKSGNLLMSTVKNKYLTKQTGCHACTGTQTSSMKVYKAWGNFIQGDFVIQAPINEGEGKRDWYLRMVPASKVNHVCLDG